MQASTTYDTHSPLRLRYALLKGTTEGLRFIDDVPNGLKCNCICAHCGKELIARNNPKNKREHHFAHRGGNDCKGARMTTLHKLAQQIIEQDKRVMLPDYKGLYHQVPTTGVEFDEIQLEQTYSIQEKQLRPDCVGIKYDNNRNPHPLWIEIYVTHEVNTEKQKAIKEASIACIEIDLSDMLDSDYTEESIAERLQIQKEDRTWISCPNYDKIENKKREEAEREEAERRRLRREENERISNLKQKMYIEVQDWYRDKSSDIASSLIAQIKKDPYTDGPKVFDYLIPHGDFISYVLKSPKNTDGLNVYYTLLRYYYNQVTLAVFPEIKRHISNTSYNPNPLSQEEKIEFEEWVSLRILYILERGRKRDREIDFEDIYKNCIKKYISDSNVRNEVLMIVSVLYHHILGSNAQSFGELTEEIIKKHPSIAKLYLSVIEHQEKYPNDYRLEERDMLQELRDFVRNNNLKATREVENIIKQCYGFAIDPPQREDSRPVKQVGFLKSFNYFLHEFNQQFEGAEAENQSVPF